MTHESLNARLKDSSPVTVESSATLDAALSRLARQNQHNPPTRKFHRKNVALLAGAGVLVLGTTAAALPSIFDAFGPVDYQSAQEYTVDGRGPFRCEWVMRINPGGDGETEQFLAMRSFVQTNDWRFDDSPQSLESSADSAGDLSVMSNFISTAWMSEFEARFPDWQSSVDSVESQGTCVNVVDGSAP